MVLGSVSVSVSVTAHTEKEKEKRYAQCQGRKKKRKRKSTYHVKAKLHQYMVLQAPIRNSLETYMRGSLHSSSALQLRNSVYIGGITNNKATWNAENTVKKSEPFFFFFFSTRRIETVVFCLPREPFFFSQKRCSDLPRRGQGGRGRRWRRERTRRRRR